jgi:hypothetical protein
MTLTEFLLARILEDEAVARAATPGPWAWEPPSTDSWPQGDESLVALGDDWQPDSYFGGCSDFLRGFHGTRELDDGSHLHRTATAVVSGWGHDACGTSASDEDRAHIARHDPARVLAECEAKRRIVERHYEVPASDIMWSSCPVCRETWPCPDLRALASVYADHADYREEWRV